MAGVQTLELLPGLLAICQLPASADWPHWAQGGPLLAMIHTPRELTVVCLEQVVPPGVLAERSWRALEVLGPLDFSLVGVLAALLDPLRGAGVSVFALSAYSTDYLLVRQADLDEALTALMAAGHTIRGLQGAALS